MELIEAVKRAKTGDQQALTYLYESTYRDKYYIALKYMKNEQDAQDILQDAYIKMFSGISKLEDPTKFNSWLSMIVANTAKDAIRKSKPEMFVELESENDEGEYEELQVADSNTMTQPEVAYTVQETQDMVRQLIDELPDDQRMCILMFHIEGNSIQEIASATGVSDNTVKSRLNYGRKAIKAKAEELQRRGYKLYSTAPLTLILYLIGKEAGLYGANGVSAKAAELSMASFAGNAYGAAGNIAGVSGITTGATGTTTSVTGNSVGATGTTANASGSPVGATANVSGSAVKAGFLSTTIGKVVLGVGIAAVVGIITIVSLIIGFVVKSRVQPTTETSTEAITVASTEASTEELTEEETEEVTTEEETTEATTEALIDPETAFTEYAKENFDIVQVDGATFECDSWSMMPTGSELPSAGVITYNILDIDNDGDLEMLAYVNTGETTSEGASDYQKIYPTDREELEVYKLIIYEYVEGEVIEAASTDVRFGACFSYRLAINDDGKILVASIYGLISHEHEGIYCYDYDGSNLNLVFFRNDGDGEDSTNEYLHDASYNYYSVEEETKILDEAGIGYNTYYNHDDILYLKISWDDFRDIYYAEPEFDSSYLGVELSVVTSGLENN